MRKLAAAAFLLLASLLAACAASTTPLYGPDTPRNGAGVPVDPVHGTTLPGVQKPY
jgi:hypothetical protein